MASNINKYITGGYKWSLGITHDQKMWAWGWNSGMLGDNTANDKSSPVAVAGNRNFIGLAGGESHSLGLESDGSAWGWGWNFYGELGTDLVNSHSSPLSSSSPISVQGDHSFIQIAAGLGHSLALKADGSLWSWGKNNYGQLGQNSRTSSHSPIGASSYILSVEPSPAAVVGGHVFSDITGNNLGQYCSAALKPDGSLWTWGKNPDGQLGHDDKVSISSPVSVFGGHSFIKMSVGRNFMLALKGDGSAWAWGNNDGGKLGNWDKTVKQSTPVSVVGGHAFIKISAGYYHSLALKADGTLWSWGDNVYGQLGHNDKLQKSSPMSVFGGHSFIEIGVGGEFSLALKADGSLWTWGINVKGVLGINSKIKQSTPVSVVGGHFFGSSPVVGGWTGIVAGITNPGKVLGVLSANIARVIGSPVPSLSYSKDADVDVDVNITISLPDTFKCIIHWGDGNSSVVTGPQSETIYNHIYDDASAYAIRITGDFNEITLFSCYDEPISGDIGEWNKLSNVETLWLHDTSVSGDIADLSTLTNLEDISLSSTSVSGDIANLSTLTNLYSLRLNSTSVSGDIADLSTLTGGLFFLYLYSTSIDTYTQGVLPSWDWCWISIQDLGLSEQEVDDFLCDVDTASTMSMTTIDISGTNSAPSGVGDTCITSLEGKGWTVTVTA